jgi:hypothetical protein
VLILTPRPAARRDFLDYGPTGDWFQAYLAYSDKGSYLVVPGVGAPVTHFCDCLGDEFLTPQLQFGDFYRDETGTYLLKQ